MVLTYVKTYDIMFSELRNKQQSKEGRNLGGKVDWRNKCYKSHGAL